MIEQVLERGNLKRAYQKVVAKKGAGGIDGLEVTDLKAYLAQHGETMIEEVRTGSYQPSPIKGVRIPKSNGKTRLLGIPTVADRMLQQALVQALEPLRRLNAEKHCDYYAGSCDRQ